MKKWILLILLVAAAAAASIWTSKTNEEMKPRVEELKQELPEEPKSLGEAVLEPGRVVELETAKGKIAFALLEKDCPKTTARIADLVENGFYDGVKFERVEHWLIQTGKSTKDVEPMGCEVLDGLTHAVGAVGMARKGRDYQSGTSVFYILLKPGHHLDGQYTVFGHVVKGMEIVKTIEVGDEIASATLRPISDDEAARLRQSLSKKEAVEQKE